MVANTQMPRRVSPKRKSKRSSSKKRSVSTKRPKHSLSRRSFRAGTSAMDMVSEDNDDEILKELTELMTPEQEPTQMDIDKIDNMTKSEFRVVVDDLIRTGRPDDDEILEELNEIIKSTDKRIVFPDLIATQAQLFYVDRTLENGKSLLNTIRQYVSPPADKHARAVVRGTNEMLERLQSGNVTKIELLKFYSTERPYNWDEIVRKNHVAFSGLSRDPKEQIPDIAMKVHTIIPERGQELTYLVLYKSHKKRKRLQAHAMHGVLTAIPYA